MTEVRVIIRCSKDVDHAKTLRLRADEGKVDTTIALAKLLAALLDGSSPLYLLPPGDLSPIGHCGLCGAKWQCEVKVMQSSKKGVTP